MARGKKALGAPFGTGSRASHEAAGASSPKASIPSAGELSCDVCSRPAIGVASSGYGAISHAYCRECVDRNAEPLTGFDYLYDFVSTDGEGLRPEIQDWVTFKGGHYVTWPEYVAERHQGPVCEVHKVHVRASGCDLCGYEKWCAEAPSCHFCGGSGWNPHEAENMPCPECAIDFDVAEVPEAGDAHDS